MSATIDERIVEMKFDDDEFEKGVKSTLEYLEKLKKELKLEDAAESANKAFKEISKASEKVNFDGLEAAIDKINYRMSTLGQIGSAVVTNLTNSAINIGKSLMSTVLTKGWNRATNIDQAMFTLEGLGLDVAQAMEDADFAVTDTAYGLDEAAKAASQLAASGVQLGDDMQRALLAISGTAAMTNSDFSSMADIFTTIAGNGRVMTMQLNQMSSRGLNAAAALAEYYGVAEAEIRDAVTHGEISFEMFYQAMSDMYGEHAKAANKTYEGAFANLQAALGRISQPWWTQFRSSATDLFNTITPKIKEFKAVFDEIGGWAIVRSIKWIIWGISQVVDQIKVSKTILKAIRISIYQPFKWVLLTFREIGKVAKDVFDLPTFKQVEETFGKIHKWFKNIYDTYGITIGKIFRGEEFDIPLLNKIKDIFGGIFSVINIGAHGVKTIVKLAMPFLRLIPDVFDKLLSGGGSIGKALQNLNKLITGDNKFNQFVDNISKIDLKDTFKNAGSNLTNFFKKMNEGGTTFATFKKGMDNVKSVGLVATFDELSKSMTFGQMVGNAFLTVIEKIVNFGKGFKQIISDMKNGMSFSDAFKNTSFGSKLAENMNKIKDTFKNVDILSAPMSTLKEKFASLTSDMGFGGTIFAGLTIGLQKTVNGLKKFAGGFKTVFSSIKDSGLFKALADGVGKLRDNIAGFKYDGSGLQKFFHGLKEFASGVANGVLTVIIKIVEGFKIVGMVIGGAISAMAGAIKNSNIISLITGLGDSGKEMGQNLMALPTTIDKMKTSLNGGGDAVKNFFQSTFSGWTATDWMHSIETGILTAMNASLIGVFQNIKKQISSITGLISSVKTIVDNFKKLGKDVGKALKNWSSSGDKKSTFESIANGFKTICQGILMIVGAIVVLALIPQDKLNKGFGAITYISALVMGMIVTVGAVSKKAGSQNTVRALTSGVLKICAGMMLIGIALAAFSKNNPASIFSAGLVMMGMMEIIILIFKQFQTLMGSVKGGGSTKEAQQELLLEQFTQFTFIIKEISKAILLMSVSLAILAGRDTGSILSSGAVVLATMWSIFAIFKKFSDMQNSMQGKDADMDRTINNFAKFTALFKEIGKSFLAISAALTIISGASKAFGAGRVWSSFAMLELLMWSVLAIAKVAGKADSKVFANFDKLGKGMLGFAAAMVIMSIAIGIIGSMDTNKVLQGVLAISTLMVVVGVMAELSKNNDNLLQLSVAILSMGGAMIMLAGAMKMLDGIDATSIIAGTGVLLMFTAALSILIGVTSSINDSSLLTLSVAIISFAGAMLIMAGAMRMLDGLDDSWRSIAQLGVMMAALVAAIVVLDKLTTSVSLVGIAFSITLIAAAVLELAAAMAVLDGLQHSWRTLAQISILLAAVVAAALVLTYTGAAAGLIMFGAAVEMFGSGLGKAALGIGLFITAFALLMDVFGGAADVAAAELVAFMETLAAGLGAVGVTLATSITLIIKNIWNNIVAMAPDIADGIMVMLEAIVNALDEYGPTIAEKGLNALSGIIFAIARSIRSDIGIATAFNDLGNAVMARISEALGNVLSQSDNIAFKFVGEALLGSAEEYKAAADQFTAAEDEFAAKQKQRQAEYQRDKEKFEGESGSILDGANSGLSIDGILGGLTSGDINTELDNILGGVNISDMSSEQLTDKLKTAIPGIEDFSGFADEGLDGWVETLQESNPDLDLSTLKGSLMDELDVKDDVSEVAEDATSTFDEKFNKKLTKLLDGTEEHTSEAMSLIKDHFGEGSDEVSRLIESGGWAKLKDLGSDVADGIKEGGDAIGELANVMQTATDTEISEAEAANEEIYDKYYERGVKITEGLSAGMKDSGAQSDLATSSYKTARDTAAGVTDTLSMGNWNSPSASIKMINIGKYVVQGLIDGLDDSTLKGELVSKATALGNAVEKATKDALEIQSPSKKLIKVGYYAGMGLVVGIKSTGKTVRKTSKALASSVVSSVKAAGVTLSKQNKKIVENFKSTYKKLAKHPNSKKLNKAYNKSYNNLIKMQKKVLGLSKGKKGTAQIRLWESSDDYAELRKDLKGYQKERTKIRKNLGKKVGKNYEKMSVKELNAEYKKLNKSNKKEDKAKAKRLKKYIDQLKDVKKNIKETNKEIKKGYKKYWKEYWKDVKDNANETFRSLFTGDARKTFELFTTSTDNSINILNASASKTLDILSKGASNSSSKFRVLATSIEKVTDALASTYETSIDLFSEFATQWYNPSEFLEDMHDNVKGYEDWTEYLDKLESRPGTESLVEYIEDLGFSADSLSKLKMFVDMNDSQLAEAVYYLAKKEEYEKQMYLDNIEKTVSDYNDWSDDLDKLYGKVSDGVYTRIKDMGVEGAKYVKMLLSMNESELGRVEKVFAEEARIAVKAYTDSINEEYEKYSKWKSNMAGLKDYAASLGITLSDEFVKSIKDMGIDGADYLQSLYDLDASDFKTTVPTIMALYDEQLKEDSKDYISTMEESVDDYQNYLNDIMRISKSTQMSDALKEELYSLGYEGYDTIKKFINMIDYSPDLISKANNLIARQNAYNAQSYFAQMQDEVTKYAKWVENIKFLQKSDLDRGFMNDLVNLGVDGAEKVASVVAMVNQGLTSEINDLYTDQQKANANSLLNSTRQSMADWQEYYAGIAALWNKENTAGVSLDRSIIQKIEDMGVDGIQYIREIASMTKEEIKELNNFAQAEKTITKDNLMIDLRKEKKKAADWGEALKDMAEKGFSPELIQEMIDAGYEASYDKVMLYAQMDTSEMAEINTLYEKAAAAKSKAEAAYKTAADKNNIKYAKEVRTQMQMYSDASMDLIESGADFAMKTNDTINEYARNNVEVTTAYLSETMKAGEEETESAMQDAGDNTKELITQFGNELTDQSSTIVNKIVKSYVDTLKESSTKIQSAIYKAFKPTTGAGSTQRKVRDKFERMASLCVTSFKDTLKSNDSLNKIQKAAVQVANAALKAAKKALGINSPSREFRYIAEYAIAGFANGMVDNANIAGDAASYMANTAYDNAAGIISDMESLGSNANLDLGIQPIFDPDAAATGLAAIDEMIQAKQLAVQSLSFDNLSDISTLQSLNDSLNNLTAAITNMESYGERLDNIQTVLDTYLPEAATDVYLDGDKLSNHVERTISNNIIRRRAGW